MFSSALPFALPISFQDLMPYFASSFGIASESNSSSVASGTSPAASIASARISRPRSVSTSA